MMQRGKPIVIDFYLGDVLPPLQVGLAWHVKGELDLELLKTAAELFVGRQQFPRLFCQPW